MLHHRGMEKFCTGPLPHMWTRHVMQFHKFLVCVHRINSRRRKEWSLGGFSYPIFMSLLKILVWMKQKNMMKFHSRAQNSMHYRVCLIFVFAKPRKKSKFDLFMKGKRKNDEKFSDVLLFPLDKFPLQLIMFQKKNVQPSPLLHQRTEKLINYLIKYPW